MSGFGKCLVGVALISLLISSCADGGADHLLLDRFFAASRLRDRTALARLSTVIFEPSQDGIVERITVLSSTRPEAVNDPALAGSPGDAAAADHPIAIVARLSLDTALQDDDPPAVLMVTRHITVRARLRRQAGEVAERVITVTVQRAVARDPVEKSGRWIVTGFK